MADRFRTPRKEKQWGAIFGASQNLSAFGLFTTVGKIDFTSKQTVLRMIGEYVITSRPVLANADEADVTVAIGKFATDAYTLGATAMPEPNQEPEFPWLYWASHPFHSTGTEADNNAQVNGISVRHSFDIRTMRKFSPGETLGFVIQAEDVAGSPAMDIHLGTVRVLLTIH